MCRNTLRIICVGAETITIKRCSSCANAPPNVLIHTPPCVLLPAFSLPLPSAAAAICAVQILLQQHLPKSNPLVSMSIFAPPCFLLLLPVALSFEPGAFATLAEPAVGVTVLINTLTAFVLNLAVVMLVQKGSGLILTLAGIVKDIALIVASIFIFANPVTPIQVRYSHGCDCKLASRFRRSRCFRRWPCSTLFCARFCPL